MTTEQDLEALYGRQAPYSEHKIGDSISYVQEGKSSTGRIIWVCARGQVSEDGPVLPLRYIVETAPGDWPATVYPQEIVIE